MLIASGYTFADYSSSTVQLRGKTLLSCILLLTTGIETIEITGNITVIVLKSQKQITFISGIKYFLTVFCYKFCR